VAKHLTQAQRRERSRRKLIDAAIEVLARHGFHGATVDVIAKRAGYSTGALYANFAGKDELFLAVFDRHVAWFDEQVAKTFAAADTTAAAEDWHALVAGSPQQFLIFIEFWAYAVRRPKVRREFAKRLAEMRATVAQAIRMRAEQRGTEPPVDPALGALVALAGGRGLALETVVHSEAVDEKPLLELLSALIA
jgi:AcrR family transcriptional regulator